MVRGKRCIALCSIVVFVALAVGFAKPVAALDVDQDGWTIFTPSDDTREVYVSSSGGNDNNDGLSEANAVATISHGFSLLRDGYPDWLLLKRGDVWYEDLSDMKSGRSESERFVVTSYGASEDRPLLKTGTGGVLDLNGHEMSHVAFVGLDCYAHTRDPDSPDYSGYAGSTGFRFVGSGSNILWEDCVVRFYENNFTVQTYPSDAAHFTNVELRRCMLLDSYSTGGHAQGIYGQKIDGLLFEECFFDHCGWLIQGDGGYNADGGKATMYNHSTYLNTCTDVTFRRNATLRPSSIHNKFTMDGTQDLMLDNNLYVDGEIITSIGGNDTGPYRFQNVTFQNNVAHLIGESQPTGRTLAWGIDLLDWDGGTVNNNIFSTWGNDDVTNVWAINMGVTSGGAMRNVTIEDNTIYGLTTSGSAVSLDDTASVTNVTVSDNDLQTPGLNTQLIDLDAADGTYSFSGQRYWTGRTSSEWFSIDGTNCNYNSWVSQTDETGSERTEVSYPDPDRTVETYMVSLGKTGTVEAFSNEKRSRPIHTWWSDYSADAVNDYVRAGFTATGAPTANDDSYSVDEDTELNVSAPGVLDNDTDPESDPLTAIKVSDPSHGSVTLNSNGSFDYTPDADYSGSDSFTYKANDGTNDSNVATVSITVNAINDAPVASDDSYSTEEDTELNVSTPGVLSNDTDADGDDLTAIKVTDPSHGSLTLNSNGSFTYTPDTGYTGDDSFTYKANDGTADSNTATVTITVYEANDPPTANDDAYNVDEDETLNVSAPGVLDNDTDPESDPLTAAKVSDPSHGSLTLNSNGSFDYTPDANYNGADSFTYKANDGTSDSNTATVSITVNAVNDAPVANDDSYETEKDTELNVNAPGVLDNDTDADGDDLTAIKVTDPSHGSLTLNSNGSFTYTPDNGYTGDDSFTYKANDGTADSNTATVTITVSEAADIYVDDDYDSNTPGWQVDHFDVIQDGIDAASDGDTVIVYAGTYTENIDFSGKDITLTSEDPDDSSVVAATIIDGGGSSNCVTMNSGETLDSIIEGFTLQNGSGNGSAVYAHNGGATVRRNVITGCSGGYWGAVHSYGDAYSIVVEGNTITNCSGGNGGAIALHNTASATIRDNVIYGNSSTNTGTSNGGGAIHCLSPSTVTIENNLIYENSSGSRGGGIFIRGGTVTLTNNTIADNSCDDDGGGVFVRDGAASVTIQNCTIWGNTAVDLGDEIRRDSGSVTIRYTDVQSAEVSGSVTWGSGNVESDPLFEDAANDDYHIDSGSPCIDAADGDEAPSEDLDGNSRYDDPNTSNTGTGTPDYADMGSYEYQG